MRDIEGDLLRKARSGDKDAICDLLSAHGVDASVIARVAHWHSSRFVFMNLVHARKHYVRRGWVGISRTDRIAELMDMFALKIVRIDGLAASMASVIAMVGDEVIMPSNSMLTIHNPWGSVGGGAEQIKSFGDVLTTMKENIIGAYVKRTKLDVDFIRSMMNAERGYPPTKRCGLALRIASKRH